MYTPLCPNNAPPLNESIRPCPSYAVLRSIRPNEYPILCCLDFLITVLRSARDAQIPLRFNPWNPCERPGWLILDIFDWVIGDAPEIDPLIQLPCHVCFVNTLPTPPDVALSSCMADCQTDGLTNTKALVQKDCQLSPSSLPPLPVDYRLVKQAPSFSLRRVI